MRCVSYKNGKLADGVSVGNKKLKTCAIKLNVPCDWDTDKFINTIREKKLSDILLYGCAEIMDGDSKSSIFPEDCVLVRCDDPLSCGSDVECMDVNASAEYADFVVLSGGAIHDRKTGNYIINNAGELSISPDPPTKPEHADADYTILF